jgi:hypothetical protein
MMFGEYHYRVSQGMITMPPRARQFFTTAVKFLLLEKGCVAGVPSVGGLPMDRRDRVTLPSKLRKVARTEDEVVVLVGPDDYFEVWGRENWELDIGQAQAEAVRLR